MKKLLVIMMLLAVLVSISAAPVYAAGSVPMPVSQCTDGFELHSIGEHEDHDHHIGLTMDLNGDGSICVKRLANGLHLHMDNVIR